MENTKMTTNGQPQVIIVKQKRGCLSGCLITLLIIILLCLLAPYIFGVGIFALLGVLISYIGLSVPSTSMNSEPYITDKSSYTATYERNTDKSSTITFDEFNVLEENTNEQLSINKYYSAISKIFFHDSPDKQTQRKGYLVQGEVVFIEEIKNGFGYTIFTNAEGQKSKGWLKMSELIEIIEPTMSYNSLNNEQMEYSIISVVDSALAFRCKLVEFPSINDKRLLKDIYDIISVNKEDWRFSDYSKTGLLQAINNHKNYLANEQQRKELLESYSDAYDILEYVAEYGMLDDISLDVYSKDDNIVTIAYVFEGHRGGVGWETEEYITFDKNTEQQIKVSDILKNREDKTFWDGILRKYANTHNNCLNDESIPTSDRFYFDKHTITFIYGKYEIACGADGIVHITVPLSEIRDYLKPQFVERYLSL